MLAYKPHTARILLVSDVQGELGVNEDIGHQKDRWIECFAQPTTPQRALEATGLDIEAPWTVFLEIDDAELISDGCELEVCEVILRVKSPILRKSNGLPGDHAVFYAEEVRR